MKQVKVSEAQGPALDYLVAMCLSYTTVGGTKNVPMSAQTGCGIVAHWTPSTNWSQGGPIIEKEKIEIYWRHHDEVWVASNNAIAKWDEKTGEFIDGSDCRVEARLPLIAAMRCYCWSKLGDVVDIPEELCQ